MLIFVRALSGTVIRVNVSPCETVLAVKNRILQTKGIPVNQQHLIYDGVELENSTLLAAARISHGALLRLVLGLQSGPMTRESAHASCTAQFCRKPSAHSNICPLMTPFHQLQAPTVLLPVLCAPTRVPEPPPVEHHSQKHELHYHHLHHHYSHHHPYRESQSHPTGHVTDYPTSDSSQQHSTYLVEWDDSQSFVSEEFVVDDDSLSVTDDGMSEIAEYLGYAIDENEFTFQQQQLQQPTSSTTQSIAGDRSPSSSPLTRINSMPMQSNQCPLVPMYPIHSQLQWFVDQHPIALTSGSQPSDHLLTGERPRTVPVTRFSPVSLALGIPVPFVPVQSSPTCPAQANSLPLILQDAASSSRSTTARHTSPPSSSMAFAHPCTVQLTNFVSSLSCWSGVNSALIPTAVPNLLLPQFTLIPVGVTPHVEQRVSSRMEKESDPTDTCCSPSMPSPSTSIPTGHSIFTHAPETKEKCLSSTETPSTPSLPTTTSTGQTRCFTCQKRTRPARGFSCRCQRWFCQRHHHPEDHSCLFNFKTMSINSTMTVPCSSQTAVVSESGSSERQ